MEGGVVLDLLDRLIRDLEPKDGEPFDPEKSARLDRLIEHIDRANEQDEDDQP